MISCVFNNWAEDYMNKYVDAGKLKRIFLKLNLKRLYLLDRYDEGYENVIRTIEYIDGKRK